MRWHLSNRADPRGKPLADRHYNRQNPDSPQYAPPGGCVVLLTEQGTALWITSTPKAEYVQHAWAGAWVNSLFRNEHPPRRHRCHLHRQGLHCPRHLSSDLIREAVAASRSVAGDPPELGLVTFVDAGQVRAKVDPGRCYLEAGFKLVGKTKGGLLTFQMLPEDMPPPAAPLPEYTDQLTLWEVSA